MVASEQYLVIKGNRILLPDGVFSGCIFIKDGRIIGIEREFDPGLVASNARVKFKTSNRNAKWC